MKYSYLSYFLKSILLVTFFLDFVYGSLGDRLTVFQQFQENCIRANCSNSDSLKYFNLKQPFYLKLLGWNCLSECRLEAQWKVIDKLNLLNVSKIPQFNGKWTFYRMYGIQEPASFVFSLCNFLTNIYCWNQYRIVGKTANDPYYSLWLIQILISSNAWICSAIYHARETSITEKLDYFSAYLFVLYLFYTITVKFLSEIFFLRPKAMFRMTIAIPFIAFYLYHINYLYFYRFDYGYNMKINVMTGIASTICWLTWCFINRKHRPHIRKCFFSLIFVNVCLALELFDFSPFFYTFDAHSLWHLATSFFPFIWYSFLKDEAIYLVTNLEVQQKLIEKQKKSID